MDNHPSSHPQQGKVNRYFQAESPFWNEVYTSPCARTDFIRERQLAILKWIDTLGLPTSSRVLEVGCGAGNMAVELALRGFRVHALDSVPAMVELAKGNAASAGVSDAVSLSVGDIYSLGFSDASFDLVLAIGVMAWLDYPEVAAQELARVAKPGGLVILTSANKAGLARLLDPLESPLLQPFKLAVKGVLVKLGLRSRTPRMFFHSKGYIDKMLGRNNLVKLKGTTCGFGFSFFRRQLLPGRLGTEVNRILQLLADENYPGFRSIGTSYIVMTRKSASS